MKKFVTLLLTVAMIMSLAICGGVSASADDVTIKVAAIETAYGSQVWADVAAAFEAETCRTASSPMLSIWQPVVLQA